MQLKRSIQLLSVVSALSWGLSSALGAAGINVTASTAQNTTLQVGQTITLNIDGSVTNPQDSNDGIFTFDQNLIIAPVPSGGNVPLQVIGVSRPGVDDALYGGSNGTNTLTGANGIYGGYDSQTEGVISSVTLYTVTLQAVTPGAAVVSSGPSVNPYGVDFLLYETTSPSVDYAAGPMITVVPVPEPATVSGLLFCMAYGFKRARL